MLELEPGRFFGIWYFLSLAFIALCGSVFPADKLRMNKCEFNKNKVLLIGNKSAAL
jgi:hypothetical protein